jgi:2,3-dihydroxybenzoate decarboxylase
VVAQWARKLRNFSEYRLPEMDAAGIEIQMLSLTVPRTAGRHRRGDRAGGCPVRQ